MASKVFNSTKNKAVMTTNKAGGKAVALNAKETLSKYVVTCTFNDTYYASGAEHLDDLKSTIAEITDNEFIAKCAIYSRKTAQMKDMPAYLLNVLYERDKGLFAKVFDRVIDSGRMLRTFLKVARSDAFNRNVAARSMRRVLQSWFDSKTPDWLFANSLGNDPSFNDIIKMTHIKGNKNQDLFSYLLDKEYNVENLPEKLQQYLGWKKDRSQPVPDVNFRLLDSMQLTTDEWSQVLKSCNWNTLRMNLATFTRQDVFKDKKNLKYACNKLVDKVPSKVFPHEIFAAYKMNEGNLALANALNDVMEKSVENLPEIKGKTIIAIDVSGSMGSKVSDKSSISCVDMAAMFGAAMSRRCEDVSILTFDTSVRTKVDNPKMSILTLAKSLVADGGGTSIRSVLTYIKTNKIEFNNLIIISDNESWRDSTGWFGTPSDGPDSFDAQWEKMRKNRKLISIDLVPNGYTNASTKRKNNLFVGGFNDSVWEVIKNFLENSENFTCQIEKTVV